MRRESRKRLSPEERKRKRNAEIAMGISLIGTAEGVVKPEHAPPDIPDNPVAVEYVGGANRAGAGGGSGRPDRQEDPLRWLNWLLAVFERLDRWLDTEPARQVPGTRRRGRSILPDPVAVDPGIPLDRLPYFLTDLARVGIVAGTMVLLLVLAALVVLPLVVR